MLVFHPVKIDRELDRSNPLYVGNFFKLKGMWWNKRKMRQGLIISMALAWHRLHKNHPGGEGFIEKETLLTNITKQVKDAKVILERFFIIKRKGFNYGADNKSPSIITPRRLSKRMKKAIEEILDEALFDPGHAPTDPKLTVSMVEVRRTDVIQKLKDEGRDDLIAPVTWLLAQPSPIKFYFEATGSLQARDKSVWPIRSIELWPGWLRMELFGTSVDIESAYVQYIVQNLENKYTNNPRLLALKYPDLLRADKDKNAFRHELCELLMLKPEKANIDVVKKLIMALANGSNATPALMTNGSARSEAVRIVHEACPHLLPTDLVRVGKRLSIITKQFSSARRSLCTHLLNARPTRKNQKKIFSQYFTWERNSRYKIWEAGGKTGLMLHDGIDGMITTKSNQELADDISNLTSIRVSVVSPAA